MYQRMSALPPATIMCGPFRESAGWEALMRRLVMGAVGRKLLCSQGGAIRARAPNRHVTHPCLCVTCNLKARICDEQAKGVWVGGVGVCAFERVGEKARGRRGVYLDPELRLFERSIALQFKGEERMRECPKGRVGRASIPSS